MRFAALSLQHNAQDNPPAELEKNMNEAKRVDPLVGRRIVSEADLREALKIYRDLFRNAIVWVELDSLREGMYRNAERADDLTDETKMQGVVY